MQLSNQPKPYYSLGGYTKTQALASGSFQSRRDGTRMRDTHTHPRTNDKRQRGREMGRWVRRGIQESFLKKTAMSSDTDGGRNGEGSGEQIGLTKA